MDVNVVFMILSALLGFCPLLLVAWVCTLYLKRSRTTAGLLMLIGSLLDIAVAIFYQLHYFTALNGRGPVISWIDNLVMLIVVVLGLVGSFCFAIGFYKLIRSLTGKGIPNETA